MSDPTSPRFKEIWDAAIERYEDITHKRLSDLDLRTLQTVDGLERHLDKERNAFDEYRGKKAILFRVMRNALIPVELLGNLAAGGASMAFPPSSLIFGAVSYLVGAAKDVSSTYDSIQKLMEELQEFTGRLSVYSREKISPELQLRLANSLATLIEIFALSRRAVKHRISGRVLGFGKAIVLGRDPDVESAVARLNKLTRFENLLVSAETHTEVSRQGRAVDEVTAMMSATSLAFAKSQSENSDKLSKVYELLKDSQTSDTGRTSFRDKMKRIIQPSVYPEDTYQRLARQHLAGTGEWIFNEQVFNAWALEKELPVIFVQGIPGAGKSFLSTSIISYFKQQYPQGVRDSAQVSVCYFYFKDNDPNTRSIHQALRDIAFQIYINDAIYARYLDSNCSCFDDVKTIESAWRILFENYFSINDEDGSSAFIVLDGLDEAYAADREVFLPLLQSIASVSSGSLRLHLALVGRPQLSDEIAVALETDATPTISVDAAKNSEDIESYVNNSIKKSRKLRMVPRDLQVSIRDSLTERASGMFLWVDLMLRELSTKNHPSAMREALRNAPKGLDAMIQRVLEGLSASLSANAEAADDLNELLAWVTCAQKPLTLGNLDAMLRYRSKELFSLESLLREDYACFFLLEREDGFSTADIRNLHRNGTIDKTRPDNHFEEFDLETATFEYRSDPESTYVNFCHASIGDYFRNKDYGKVRLGEGPAIGVDIKSAMIDTLKTVISLCVDSAVEKTGPVHDLRSSYSAQLWDSHMRAVDISTVSRKDKEDLGPMLVKFCKDHSSIETWVSMVGYNFWTEDYTTLLRKWLSDPELLSTLPQYDQDWIVSTEQQPSSLFLEVTRFLAAKWLQEEHWSALECFYMVWGYHQTMAGVMLQPRNEPLASAKIIEETAKWAELKENAFWHWKVASACKDASFLEDAEKHYRAAMDMNPTMWRLHFGLALVCEMREEYEKAIEHCDAEIKMVEANSGQSASEQLEWLAVSLTRKGDLYNKLNQHEESCTAYREACFRSPFQYDALTKCVEHLDLHDRYDEAMAVIESVFRAFEAFGDTPWLFCYMAGRDIEPGDILFAVARRAARETGHMAYLLQELLRTLKYCASSIRRVHGIIMTLDLVVAEVYMYERIDSGEAIQIWERILRLPSGSQNETVIYARIEANMHLSRYYLSQARGREGPEKAQFVSKLEDMATTKTRSGKNYEWNRATLALGLWHRLNGSPDKAKACCRVHVKQALQFLSDDDPDNDTDGFIYLANALFRAGDEERAEAIFQKISCLRATKGDQDGVRGTPADPEVGTDKSEKQQPDHEASTTKQGGCNDDDSDPGEDQLGWICHGTCSAATPRLRKNPFWICRYCIDVSFCADCLVLVQDNKLQLNVCHPEHSWMKVQPTLQPIPTDQILIGGDKFVSLDEFKKDLRKDWGL